MPKFIVGKRVSDGIQCGFIWREERPPIEQAKPEYGLNPRFDVKQCYGWVRPVEGGVLPDGDDFDWGNKANPRGAEQLAVAICAEFGIVEKIEKVKDNLIVKLPPNWMFEYDALSTALKAL